MAKRGGKGKTKIISGYGHMRKRGGRKRGRRK